MRAAGGPGMEVGRPFFLPAPSEQRVSTRQAPGGGDKRRQKQAESKVLVFNLVNEPWLKYAPSCIADHGYTAAQLIETRFETHVLYLESEWCVARLRA